MKDIRDYRKNSYRFEKEGWIYVYLEGEPYERGIQHGYYLSKEIDEVMRALAFYIFQNTGKEFSFFMEQAGRMFLPSIDEEFLEELQGIVDGAEIMGVTTSVEALLVWNSYLEILESWWPQAAQNELKNTSSIISEHCSAFIAVGDSTKDHRIVAAHNTWIDYVIGQHLNVILDIKPSSGFQIRMQAGPGLIHSFTDFFVTEAGIIGTETTMAGFHSYTEDGSPEFYRARKAMQYANNCTEWCDIFQVNNNGGCANSWLLGDIHSNEIFRFELGLKYQSLERKHNGYFVGFNAATNPQIRNMECSESGYNDLRTNGGRRIRLTALMDKNYGNITIDTGKMIMADHFDEYLQQNQHPSARTICAHYECDPSPYVGITSQEPYSPAGTLDAKVTSSTLAENLSFCAHFGRGCSMPFWANKFVERNPQWAWQKGYLKDRPCREWVIF